MIYFGVVEERTSDPFKIGRCKVRVFGVHTENKSELPTDDLPWAMPMQSVFQAGTSGIGRSPTGIVEGSWVGIVFSDEYKQHPIIVGVLGGVPFKQIDNTNQNIADQQVSLISQVDDTNNKVYTSAELSHSAAGEEWLMNEEALSSLTAGKNDYRKRHSNTPDQTIIYSYLDSATPPNWTIGWGSTYLEDNKTRVDEYTTRTKAECVLLFRNHIAREVLPYVKKALRVPVTQQMFDAIVQIVYNAGPRVLKQKFFAALNSGKYDEASALIPHTLEKGLQSRRAAERTLFDSEGWPTDTGQIQPTPAQTVSQPFSTNQRSMQSSQGDGFKDPKGVYPKYRNEPDTNRLARAESIDKTLVAKKENSRVIGVKTASGSTWNQPKIPYNSTYPFNHVQATESGHTVEFDDTTNNERIHIYHKSGTFDEIDANGTKVTRIVGDSYQILDRNGHIFIQGDCNVTIAGNANVRVENDANLEVLGNMQTRVSGQYKVVQSGDMIFKTGGKFMQQSTDDTSIEGRNIHLNGGFSVDAQLPTEIATGATEFVTLTTPTRNSHLDGNYETPEEGDNSEFVTQNARHSDPSENVPQTDEELENSTPEEKGEVAVVGDCENLIDSQIVQSYRLSSLFTLGDVLTGSSGYPSGNNYGMTGQQIVCNLKKLTLNCLDLIKAKYPNMKITNTWRSEAVNSRVGGSKTSDHLIGAAADIQLSGFDREMHYRAIIEIQKILPAYKQLILEYKGEKTWIHVSFLEGKNTNQQLTIDAAINKTIARDKFVLKA